METIDEEVNKVADVIEQCHYHDILEVCKGLGQKRQIAARIAKELLKLGYTVAKKSTNKELGG